MQQIADWLEKLGLAEYAQRFADNAIDCQSRHFAVQEDSEPFRAGHHEGRHRLAD